MLHTYGNSKAEGRKLCFQKRGTAGQDYSLTHRGLLGRGSEHLWQPLFREGMKCQPEASARSSAGCHTSFSQWKPERSEAASQSGTDVDAWRCCHLHGMAAAWQWCSESLIFLRFPPHLIPVGGECYRTGLSFGNKGILMKSFKALFNVGAGSSYVWTPACWHPHGCIKPSRTAFMPACRAILSLIS